MEKSLDNIVDVIKLIFNFDIVRRIFFLAGIAASVGLGIGLYNWVKEPLYTPLPYNISEQNFTAIIQELDKAGISYKINDRNNTISVPVDDAIKAKLALSTAGVQKDTDFSFSYLNEPTQLGGSQFLENARYIRALEADLSRTISALQGVSGAKVHLAIPQNNIFANENSKPSASVIVNFVAGYDSDREKVRAITQLIAASVPELDPENVVITNQYGHYLSSISNKDSLLNQEQLDYQNNLQTYYEQKIRSLITPMVGINKASISVHIDLDFTHKEEAKEEFDPAQTTVRSEQNVSESTSGSSGSGVPGSLSNQPPASGDKQAAPQSGQSRTESIKNYEISKSTHYLKASSPKIKSISVAIIVDDEMVRNKKTKAMVAQPMPQKKIDNLTDLVKSSIGFQQSRGDKITIINSSFLPEKIDAVDNIPMWKEPWFWEWAKQIGGGLFAVIFLLIIYKRFISNFETKSGNHALSSVITDSSLVTPEMMELKEEQLKILKDLVAKDPNKVANIIKKWIAT